MYKLKYIAQNKYPNKFKIPTYKENVWVIDGVAEVKFKQTRDRLLKEGFVEIIEEETRQEPGKPEEVEVKPKTKKKKNK